MALVLAWIFYIFTVSICAVLGNEPENSTAAVTPEDSTPAQSMDRLISSVSGATFPLMFKSNSTDFSPDNNTDNTPFLPSGMVPSFKSSTPYQLENSNISRFQNSKNFTPSYFIGEVIPEPYIPERFQNTVYNRNSTNRSLQNLMPSQTMLAFKKILPFVEHVKHAAFHLPPDHTYERDPLEMENHNHVPPVHEPSMEEEDATTQHYSLSYDDNDQHSDRPSRLPYNVQDQQNEVLSKPIAYPEDGRNEQKSPIQQPQYNQGYLGHHVNTGYAAESYSHSDPPSGHPSHYHGHDEPYSSYLNTYADHHSGSTDLPIEHHSYPHIGNYPSTHHETDFILPKPFFPPEPKYPTGHQKDVHYKVYEHKKKSPLHGLLHFAAALIPLGLFVAALQPSVIHVNSSQPMSNKHRSTASRSMDTLTLPGLDVLERLGLGNLQHAECERRAFCELAVLGGLPQGDAVQQGLWKLAHSIPDKYAASVGLTEAVKAVKSNSCTVLKCAGRNQSNNTTSH